ncbi:hypothetical protein [Anaerosolibacter sp.]|uniref:hypothetical protein n=1 Tax=Anaerosolibacter sp. TaxID=1872527 RepID=UPI0039F017DC
MLLYLSSNENIGIFDFLQEDHGMIIKKLSGVFMLKQFVIYDMRSLDHYQYVAIDLKALKDTETEIVEAVIAFKKMFSSRIIFYMDDVCHHQGLIQKMIHEGIYNIISDSSVEELKQNILKSISDLGITKRDIQVRLSQVDLLDVISNTEVTFVQKNIRIAVTGSMHRVGTTTTAMNLCNYLASIGASVCYVEANDHNHLQELSKGYQHMQVREDAAIYNGVKYLTLNSKFEEELDFIIYDMGIIQPKIISAIKYKCDATILCASAKPYELESYNRAIQLLDGLNVNRVFSFVPEPAKARISQSNEQVFFAEYSPDLFDGDANKAISKQIIEPFTTKR